MVWDPNPATTHMRVIPQNWGGPVPPSDITGTIGGVWVFSFGGF